MFSLFVTGSHKSRIRHPLHNMGDDVIERKLTVKIDWDEVEEMGMIPNILNLE